MKCRECKTADADPLLSGLCKMCDMFAARQAPGCMTDSVFLKGHCNGSQFEKMPHYGDQYAKIAEKAGQSVKGKVYVGGIANRPGDPRAWVSSRAEIRKVLEERGWSSEGYVNYKPAVQRDPAPDVDLAPDIVASEVEQIVSAQPELARSRKGVADLAEKVRNKRKPHWAKK